MARSAVEGAIDAAKSTTVKAEDAASAAASGAIEAADSVGDAAGRTVRDAVSGTIGGIAVVVKAPFNQGEEKKS